MFYRISDVLFNEWWDLKQIKDTEERTEREMYTINVTIDNENKSHAVAMKHWGDQISALFAEKEATEEKLKGINEKIDEAKVKILDCEKPGTQGGGGCWYAVAKRIAIQFVKYFYVKMRQHTM